MADGDAHRSTATTLFSVVARFRQSEIAYNETLRILITKFTNPLKTYGLVDDAVLEAIFDEIKTLCDRSSEMMTAIENSISTNANISSLYTLLNPELLSLFKEYCHKVPFMDRLITKSSEKSERFSAFLNVQQRSAGTTLERLLLQPSIHAAEYITILREFLNCVDKESDVFSDITAYIMSWESLDREIEEQLRVARNERKLAEIQLSYPDTELHLLPKEEETADPLLKATFADLKWSRRLSAPSALFKFMSSERSSLHNRSSWKTAQNSGTRLTLAASAKRQFIREGSIFVGKEDAKKRFVTLLNDVILIGKPRGRGMYSLKSSMSLHLTWVIPHLSMATDPIIVLGTPQEREVFFRFVDIAERDSWKQDLDRCIDNSKVASIQSEGHVNVTALLESGPVTDKPSLVETFEVTVSTRSFELITLVLARFGVSGEAVDAYSLWELTFTGVQELREYDCPFAIFLAGKALNLFGDVCHFILRKKSAPSLSGEELPSNLSVIYKGNSPAAPRHKKPAHKPNNSASNIEKQQKPDPLNSSTGSGTIKTKGLLFGVSISELMANGKLPSPVMTMLAKLYREGPSTPGIFRKSASAKMIQQLCDRLNEGNVVDFQEVPIITIGVLFKNFLRNMPDSLLPLAMYNDFISTIRIENVETRISAVSELLAALHESSLYLLTLVIVMLDAILRNSEENSMTAHNLAICVGQSLMWPEKAEDVLKNEVPPFIEFLLSHCSELFPKMGLVEPSLALFERSNSEAFLLESPHLTPASSYSQLDLDNHPAFTNYPCEPGSPRLKNARRHDSSDSSSVLSSFGLGNLSPTLSHSNPSLATQTKLGAKPADRLSFPRSVSELSKCNDGATRLDIASSIVRSPSASAGVSAVRTSPLAVSSPNAASSPFGNSLNGTVDDMQLASSRRSRLEVLPLPSIMTISPGGSIANVTSVSPALENVANPWASTTINAASDNDSDADDFFNELETTII